MPFDITVLQTGTVQVRPSQLTQPANTVLWRRLMFLLDRRWTDPLPIYAFLISHPEGYILYDTGETPRVNEPYYFPWYQVGHHCIQMDIEPHHALGVQLREKMIEPSRDIKKVILSHLHSDHAGGLADVIDGPQIYTSQEHWDVFKNYLTANIEGANPSAWPPGFVPTILKPNGAAIGPFSRSYPITKDGKIVAIDTPGHVPGHLSLIIFDEEVTYFLTGDATYGMQLLDQEKTDGINSDPEEAIRSLRKIKQFCKERPTVVLPSHDLETPQILREKRIYKPSDLANG